MSFNHAVAMSLVCLAVHATAAAAGTAELASRVTATWSVRVQADDNWLQVIEETTVMSESDPSRAGANDRPFEMRLPPEAEVLAGAMQTAGGQAVNVKPAPTNRNGDYSFPGPLPRGETRFAVGYRLRYRGQAVIRPGIPYPLSRVVIALPDAMTFEAESAGLFEENRDGAWTVVREMASPRPGQSAAFRVSGKGSLSIQAPRKQETARTVPSHSRQDTPSHANRVAASHGGASAPDGLPVLARQRHWLLMGGLLTALLAGSAVLVGYTRKRLLRVLA